MRSARVLVLLGCAALACGGGSSTAEGACTDAASCAVDGGAACPDGFEVDPATQACLDVAPTGDCAPGTAPFLGSRACKPVGWACAPPYEPDPSGWGCRPTLAKTCPTGTIETFGSTDCRPVGDCAAPFPPTNAAFVVDATLAVEDATHKKSVFTAVSAANRGDVVAVMPGTYVEDVDVLRDSVSIVGKCAAQVIVQNPGDRRAGILVAGAKGVHVSGLTLTGHMSGVLVKGGGDATVEDTLVLKNRYLGVYAAEGGSRLRVARTRIDDVVADAGKFGWGAAAQIGATIELEDVVVTAATSPAIVVANPGSTASLKRVVVRATRLDAPTATFATALGAAEAAADVDGLFVEDAQGVALMAETAGTISAKHVVALHTASTANPGRAVQVTSGGRADLVESFLAASQDANVLVVGQGSVVKVASSVIAGDPAGDGTRGSHGARAAQGGSLEVTASALIANIEVGLSVQDPGSHATADGVFIGGTRPRKDPNGDTLGVGAGAAWGGVLDMKGSAIDESYAAGVLVSRTDGVAATATLTGTLVRRTTGDPSGTFGRGVEVSRGGVATLDGCAIADNAQAGLLVGLESASLTVRRSLVRDTHQTNPGMFGHGIVADEQSSLVVDGSWLLGHPGVGLGVAGAAATVAHALVARCAVAVQVQGGSNLQLADTVPDAPQGTDVVISNDTRFIDDQTRVGAGDIPMPTVLGPSPRMTP
jgi:hypothetical protein